MTENMWQRTLDPAVAVQVRAVLSAATTADAIAPVSEAGLLALDKPDAARHLVLTSSDGGVAGYAQLVDAHDEHPAMAEVVVAPRSRRRGHGRTLVEAVLAAGGDAAQVWSHGDLPAAAALSSRLELERVRTLLQMRQPAASTADGTSDRAAARPPEGVRITNFADTPVAPAALIAVNRAAFSWHPEQGAWTEADVTTRFGLSWFDPRDLLLAIDDSGALLGFHWTKIEPGEDVGEVYVVAVDPAAQGRGIGVALTVAGLDHLAARGVTEFGLYTEADNIPAVSLYQRLGFTTYRADVAYARAAESGTPESVGTELANETGITAD